MTRTTDEINAMTKPELRAAVAVDLLGWLVSDDPRYFLHANFVAATPDEIPQRYRTSIWSAGTAMPGLDWLGVVDDAMIARGYPAAQLFRVGVWTARYAYGCGSSNPDRETATLRAVLLALAAEAAAKASK